MPYLIKQAITQHAIAQGYTANLTKSEITQNKKEPKKEIKTKLPTPMIGRFRKPPTAVIKNLESFESTNRCDRGYIEYRNGLIKKLTELTANKTLPDNEKRKIFMETVFKSSDINTLILETALIKKLDTLDGLPKLLLTVYCKWMESYI